MAIDAGHGGVPDGRRITDEGVEATEAFLGHLEELAQFVGVAHVSTDGDGAAARCFFDVCDDFGRGLGVIAVVDDDVEAVGGEPVGDGAADAA